MSLRFRGSIGDWINTHWKTCFDPIPSKLFAKGILLWVPVNRNLMQKPRFLRVRERERDVLKNLRGVETGGRDSYL